ncbi:MAG: DUF6527 family protein [Methylobacter sp.]
MKIKNIKPEYVDHLPDQLAEGTLYISEKFETAGHLCCCGCGEEVMTPLNKANWELKKSGNKISLYPSIGNWKYPCKSHYWIRNNQIIESPPISERGIEYVKQRDRLDKKIYAQEYNKVREAQSAFKAVGPLQIAINWLKRWWNKKD